MYMYTYYDVNNVSTILSQMYLLCWYYTVTVTSLMYLL